MSCDDKTDKMNWNDEIIWFGISCISGILLAALFIFYEKFSNAGITILMACCILGFYLLSILVRIQNHRGKILSGKTGISEKKLKFVFPVLGFVVGLAILFFN